MAYPISSRDGGEDDDEHALIEAIVARYWPKCAECGKPAADDRRRLCSETCARERRRKLQQARRRRGRIARHA